MNDDDDGEGALEQGREVLHLLCNNCGVVVVPDYRDTAEEMHNTDCEDCGDGLLQMRREDMVREADAFDWFRRLLDEHIERWLSEDSAAPNEQFENGAVIALQLVRRRLDAAADGNTVVHCGSCGAEFESVEEMQDHDCSMDAAAESSENAGDGS